MATNQQLQFDWSGSAANDPSSVAKTTCLPEVPSEQPNAMLEMAAPENAVSSIELPWDFATTFPEPLPEALAAGKLGDEDLSREQLASIHEEHAREFESLLRDLEAIEEAKRTGINPKTGTRPRTEKAREQLRRYLETAPSEIQQTLDILVGVYEDAFGASAASAFREAIEARHAGIAVTASAQSQSSPESLPGSELDRLSTTDAITAAADIGETFDEQTDGEGPPLARPLQTAIDAKVFGEDDFGQPIDPGEEEVESFTVVTAERMIEALAELRDVDERLDANLVSQERLRLIQQKERTWTKYHAALALYVEDFGTDAGAFLECWVKNRGRSAEPLYGRGHPWHYYSEGDGRKPVPDDEIEPAHVDVAFLGKLPKDRARRRAKLELVARDQSAQLRQDRERYRELIRDGHVALSDYDRNIAHGGNAELAWASSVALKYTHIRNSLGRLRLVEGMLA